MTHVKTLDEHSRTATLARLSAHTVRLGGRAIGNNRRVAI
jgi:hypothetical protein